MSALYELSLSNLAAGLRNKEYSVREVVMSCLERIQATEPLLNACISVLADEALVKATELDSQGPPRGDGCLASLWGVPVGLKDVIFLKGSRTTCGSRFMENFISIYDAEVVSRLKKAGAVFMAKYNLDEFAMGSTTENSAFGRVCNPWDLDRVSGGSSGGSAAGVTAGQVFAALGTDTGGSIRQPAALCGCVGLKPTYGRVSRYGVAGLASSLDHIGPLARSVEDCARVFDTIAGHDPKDATSAVVALYSEIPDGPPAGSGFAAQNARGGDKSSGLRGWRIGIPEDFWGAGLDPEVESCGRALLRQLEGQGAVLVDVKLPHQKYALAVYYIMCAAEASTNLARFDGVRYGRRAESPEDLLDLYVSSRSQGFGEEPQRRIILGTFALSSGYYDAYYRKAAQIRRLLRRDFDQALEQGGCHALLAPASAQAAWPAGAYQMDPLTMYKMDLLTVTLNLVGLPGLCLPVGLGGVTRMPIGLQIMGRPFSEGLLFKLGAMIEELAPSMGKPRALQGL